jgi:hypothetical protein
MFSQKPFHRTLNHVLKPPVYGELCKPNETGLEVLRGPSSGLNEDGRTGEQKGKERHPTDYRGKTEDGFWNRWRRVHESGYWKNKRV